MAGVLDGVKRASQIEPLVQGGRKGVRGHPEPQPDGGELTGRKLYVLLGERLPRRASRSGESRSRWS